MKARVMIEELKKYDIGPYIEVPCSILAPLVAGLLKDKDCIVMNPVNEAIAVGLATGSYLATQKIPAVLIQNSGLCNTLNAATSLNHIYRIPFLYIISWRGEPGKKDAPEHSVIGKKMERLLTVMDIPYEVLSKNKFTGEIRRVISVIRKTKMPAAILLREGLLEEEGNIPLKPFSSMQRSTAIDIIVDKCRDKAFFLATNGYISRELYYNLNKKGVEGKNPPFYMLGSMGHALAIGLGFSRFADTAKRVVVLDGDGGCLMHLGSLASVVEDKGHKLIHVVLDNGTYASTGGQPTVSANIDLCKIASGCGYKNVHRISDEAGLIKTLPGLLKKPGSTFLHILISDAEGKGRSRISDDFSCEEIKNRFIKLTGSD